tara:strand:+ start:3449 stop:4729 length:1281 start_codon:yes stop_codon:yes gene_type:complete
MQIFKILVIFIILSSHSSIANLTEIEKKIIKQIDLNLTESIQFLEKTIQINSGTFNHKGIKDCGLLYQNKLNLLGFKTIWHKLPIELNRADHLFAYRKGKKGKRLLLIGHLDTVFEPENPQQKIEYKKNMLFGPGSADMKGGNMIIVYALKALDQLGLLDNTTITVALHSDEESAGRPLSESRKHIISAAKKSDIGLGFEGGTLNTAVISRRGTSQWELKVSGRELHSSLIFNTMAGSGSIFETARILNEFRKQLSNEKYLTLNPGIIIGGSQISFKNNYKAVVAGKDNIIAKQTIVRGDLRFISNDQKEKARSIMKKITFNSLPHTKAKITFNEGYPGMPPSEGNEYLLKQFSLINEALGFGKVIANDPNSRGAADISFVSNYVDSLDGLGINGGGAHSQNEYVNLSNLDHYIKRAAILIYRLTR